MPLPYSPEQPVCVSFTMVGATSLGGLIAATREFGRRLARVLSAVGHEAEHQSGEQEVFQIADLAGARVTFIMGHVGWENEREQWRIHFVTHPDFFGLTSAQRHALDKLCQPWRPSPSPLKRWKTWICCAQRCRPNVISRRPDQGLQS